MLLHAKSKLVMIGDSITDCDRARPIGEGLFGANGKGYVSLVDALLTAAYPELGLRIVNMGTSGNTVRDLKARWQTDVLDLKPDWLSIMIGTNDVWRQYDLPTIPEQHVYIEEYEETLEQLIAQTRPQLQGLILMTPFYIEPNALDAMRSTMDQYGAAVKRLAAKYDAQFVDTQAAFNQVMKHIYPATLAWDRVHPTATGHAVLARAFLQAIGYDYNKGL
ncbi:lysophospholipase L1-like esterase [Paenibacillus phyllosphaerae]|uniref:Lysophospholipase L1-like esterase n=1 Tax=Paenibacillus phyllosphaerae TaxID=274593 RepID=A0A7W5FKY1_9BACL|nr:SGNH/GDSL hydrolase family protein [Paenibacillus phyllosphaerae]MBB3108464.1 lysophospholipase L1-like esterase [Paenibacillus phyllosphaerae]